MEKNKKEYKSCKPKTISVLCWALFWLQLFWLAWGGWVSILKNMTTTFPDSAISQRAILVASLVLKDWQQQMARLLQRLRFYICYCQSYGCKGQWNFLIRHVNQFWLKHVLIHKFPGVNHLFLTAQKSDVKMTIMCPLLMMWAMFLTKTYGYDYHTMGSQRNRLTVSYPSYSWLDYVWWRTQHVTSIKIHRVVVTMNNKQ